MRVTTDFWVSALVRRAFSSGGFAAIVKRGAQEAGAVFILSRNRMGETLLFGPAPQTAYDTARPDDRQFTQVTGVRDAGAIDARLARETRFDPDIWIVELDVDPTPIAELIGLTKP